MEDMNDMNTSALLRKVANTFHIMYLVCNDNDTFKYKGPTVMTMKERVEAIENCKWVQQVIPDAPWILDEAFLIKYDIDLVAHDDIPYAAPGQDDVYGWVRFLSDQTLTQSYSYSSNVYPPSTFRSRRRASF